MTTTIKKRIYDIELKSGFCFTATGNNIRETKSAVNRRCRMLGDGDKVTSIRLANIQK